MLDDIAELIVEIVLEGAIELAGNKAKAVVIALAALVWLAVATLLLWAGIRDKDAGLTALGAVLLAALAIWLFINVKKYRRGER